MLPSTAIDDKDNGNNGNDDDYVSKQSYVYSLNAIQQEMKREAMSADMRSRGKRSRVNNEETNTAHKKRYSALINKKQEEQQELLRDDKVLG